jgi:hypothetical protein
MSTMLCRGFLDRKALLIGAKTTISPEMEQQKAPATTPQGLRL